MPNAYDLQRLTITHSPVDKVDTAIPNLPNLNLPEILLDSVKNFITEFIFPAIEELTGIDLSSYANLFDGILGDIGLDLPGLAALNPLTLLSGLGTSSSILDQLIGVIPGIGGGLTGLPGLGSIFGDLTGLLGAPTGLGTGTPALPGIGSIPILGGLLSGGLLSGGLIPGLDASKIVSGNFGAGLLQPVIDAVSQGFGGSTGLGFSGLQSFLSGLEFAGISFDDLIGLIPGITGGLTGAAGLGSIFGDLTGLLGDPTGLGGGTPTLPGVTSIPLLGGLLSGGTFLSSLIPSLDASKITTGTFGQSMITNLVTDLGSKASASTVTAISQNIFNNWFGGSSAAGTPEEVATAVASIKSAVTAGWTVAIFSSSNSAWPVPAGVAQLSGGVINGGGKGGDGAVGSGGVFAAGGAAGSSGGYLFSSLDTTGITPGSSTLNVTVGAAAATAGANGGQSSIKFGAVTLLAGSANASGIASAEGLIGTTSTPGRGGRGGDATGDTSTSTPGTAGENTGVATGGAGGAATSGNTAGGAGGAGGAGESGSVPVSGGGGGGGGGGCWASSIAQTAVGGAGGNGGFPGGGSGGGGGASNSAGFGYTGGSGGTPGNGLVVILYK